jgi:hypothetical protein
MVHCDGDWSFFDPSERGMHLVVFSTGSCWLTDVIRFKFYCDEHVSLGENYLRFSFCKDLDTLRAAVERLQKLKKYLA